MNETNTDQNQKTKKRKELTNEKVLDFRCVNGKSRL